MIYIVWKVNHEIFLRKHKSSSKYERNVCYILVFGPHVMEEEVLQNLEPKADVAAQQCVSCMEYPSYVYCCLFFAWAEKKEYLSDMMYVSV